MKTTTKTKLQAIFKHIQVLNQKHNFCLDFLSEQGKVVCVGDFSNRTLNEFRNELFAFAVKLFDYNNLPQIVSNEKYKQMPAINFRYLNVNVWADELFRGARHILHHANMLCDDNYHMGTGDVCNGLFTTMRYDNALIYANSDSKNILKLKAPELKVVDDLSLSIEMTKIFDERNKDASCNQQVLTEIKDFVFSIEDENKRAEFVYHLINDPAIVAMFLGYDAVYDHNFPAFAILNRSKICVSEREYNRVCEWSNHRRKNQPNLE